jgi:hypothetical protein
LERALFLNYEGSGEAARVQVNFNNAGTKWLVMAYANSRENMMKKEYLYYYQYF